MRKYSQISVRVSEAIFDLFLARLGQELAGRWERDFEVEKNGNDVARVLGVTYQHFVRTTLPHAELVFLYSAGEFRLINAFTTGRGISHALHAKLTNDFWVNGLKQVCKELGLTGSRTPTQTVKPEAGLPQEMVEALYRFSVMVNRSDGGTSHPDDMALWCNFLLASHTTGVKMDESDLMEYLETKKFSYESILDLLRGYEIGLMLLRKYDRYLAAVPPAKVN